MINNDPLFFGIPRDPKALEKWLHSDGRLDILRDRLKISEIVSQTVPLEQAKRGEMRGQCPAPDHDDDQKAFFVNDLQGFFHCFGCGIHGDAIRWMTSYENVDYVEAVHRLTHQAGLAPRQP